MGATGGTNYVYFNDNEPFVTEWLRNLWPEATVDGRSITDVRPEDLEGHERVHLYAGIGGWQYALELAGWPDVPVWTASLPCQPFSTAGKRRGIADERHLWPVTRDLIDQCRPPVIFGEQVASRLGREWLAGVRADLEALGYTVGAADLCAAGVSAPHVRQRLYWVAYAERDGFDGRGDFRPTGRTEPPNGGATDRLDNPPGHGCLERWSGPSVSLEGDSAERAGQHTKPGSAGQLPQGLEGRSGTGYWDNFDLAFLRDGTTRRIEPGSFPLAHGVPARVGRIRAYGGSIVPQVAAVFIRSFTEAIGW